MIVAVAHTKGGTGKTTAAVQLALYRKIVDKRDVWLVDSDEQESASMAVGIRSESGVEPVLPCSAYSDGPTLKAQVLAQKDKWDDVIIDVGGRATDTLRAALMLCDVLLVPVQPRSYDVWALSKLQSVVQLAREVRETSFPAYCFISCAEVQGTDNEDARAAIETFPDLTFIDAQLVRRKAFSTASGLGLSVFEARPKDMKACNEVAVLANAVFGDEE